MSSNFNEIFINGVFFEIKMGAKITPKRNLEYLTDSFQGLATALARVDTHKSEEEIKRELIDICEDEFRCDHARYIPPEEVRRILEENKSMRKLVNEHHYFQEGNSFYVPLINNGYRNLGVLCLEGVTDRLSKQAKQFKDPIFDYLGLQIGMVMSLVMQRDYDKLTGLYRKDCFPALLEVEIQKARRTGQPLSLISGDLDHFGWYNNSYGHPQGDEALRTAGRIIRESTRDADLPVRNGGEEFVIILPDTDCSGAYIVAERIRSALESTRVDTSASHRLRTDTPYHLGTPTKIQGSFGIACFPTHTSDPNDLTPLSDKALYAAKERGRNKVEVYNPSFELKIKEETE